MKLGGYFRRAQCAENTGSQEMTGSALEHNNISHVRTSDVSVNVGALPKLAVHTVAARFCLNMWTQK